MNEKQYNQLKKLYPYLRVDRIIREQPVLNQLDIEDRVNKIHKQQQQEDTFVEPEPQPVKAVEPQPVKVEAKQSEKSAVVIKFDENAPPSPPPKPKAKPKAKGRPKKEIDIDDKKARILESLSKTSRKANQDLTTMQEILQSSSHDEQRLIQEAKNVRKRLSLINKAIYFAKDIDHETNQECSEPEPSVNLSDQPEGP